MFILEYSRAEAHTGGTMGTGGWILIAVIVILVAFAVAMYNRLVVLRNRYKNAFSQIDVQLKRRYDLIPNLVETAKGYIKHERETLEAVTAARGSLFFCLSQTAQRSHQRLPNRSQAHYLSRSPRQSYSAITSYAKLFGPRLFSRY